MSRSRSFPLILTSIALTSTPLLAGAMPSCITAAQSANGKILVTDTLRFDDPDETHGRMITVSIYEIHRRAAEPNDRLRLEGPNSYWADPFWKVETHQTPSSLAEACSYVLVPDDGEYLVFVGRPPMPEVLTIYHHRAHDPALGPLLSQQGLLVRKIMQLEMWPSEPPAMGYTDHSTMWFAGGHFSFSVDQKKLIFEDKLARKVEIELASGAIRHLN